MQASPTRCLASTASGNSRRHHGVVIGAQACSTARCKPIVEVRPGRGETGGPSGEARNAGPGGAVEATEEGETKRRGKGRQEPAISNVGEDGGCDEDIDVKAPRIPRNKSGRRSAVGA